MAAVTICSDLGGGGGGAVTKSFLTLAIPWTVACQAPLSMEFSRQEYWSWLPFPPPGDHPFPGIEPTPLESPVLIGVFFTNGTTWQAPCIEYWHQKR